MNLIIKSTLFQLQKSKLLLSVLTNEELANETVSPYYSSIGSHLRHILDFYDCVLNVQKSKVNLTRRKRDGEMEKDCKLAEIYLDSVLDRLSRCLRNMDDLILVTDDMGLGTVEITYTFSALLAQANSHTIHHYAIINYIMNALDITINDGSFGVNPSTPKKITFG